MRIWTLHPRYLDKQGIVALWREALLAQSVLLGKTKGYRHHPELERFRAQPDPVAALATYLQEVHREALRRGYRFDGKKIHGRRTEKPIVETEGQLLYEWRHLRAKLRKRSPEVLARFSGVDLPLAHPIFKIVPEKV